MGPRVLDHVLFGTAQYIDHDVCCRWVQQGRISPSEAIRFLQSASEVIHGQGNGDMAAGHSLEHVLLMKLHCLRIYIASWRSLLSRIRWYCLRPRVAMCLRWVMYSVNCTALFTWPNHSDASIAVVGAVNVTIAMFLLYVYSALWTNLSNVSEMIAMSRFEAPSVQSSFRSAHRREAMRRVRGILNPHMFSLLHILPMLICFFDMGYLTDLIAMNVACLLWICLCSRAPQVRPME